MGQVDDVLDELDYPSFLRIPPLQDPFPFPTTTDRRLSPLEPNARTNNNIDKEAAKLTGRGKALAEAKPIGDLEDNELRPIHSAPRKRQKQDDVELIPEFVQLPKPTAKAKDDKPPPFLPISVLNQLHEPPPSAALFPPITPSATRADQESRPYSDPSLQISWLETPPRKQDEQYEKDVKDSDSSNKRLWARKRTRWSDEETHCLVKGLDKYGVGKWTRILKDSEYSFQQGRTALDLKDRFRTLMGNARTEVAGEGVSYKVLFGYAGSNQKPDPGPSSPKETLNKPRKKPKHLWSEEEDESLVKGYQKHGFCWKDIANDESLALGGRSGPQIRDRFRKRFPDLYSEVPPPSKNPRHAPSVASNMASAFTSEGPKLGSGDQGIHPTKTDTSNNGMDAHRSKSSATWPKPTPSASAPQGINGLLNSEEADPQQSSFRSDDWDGNVTLPPLLWEDLCTKPMFELD
ncbi:MAG: hypothetical protein LQ344_003946 [Seirophora lacunosa]|nr:MAG: hypothetical protein LQ344_003946 [Seirophora lacunosa]